MGRAGIDPMMDLLACNKRCNLLFHLFCYLIVFGHAAGLPELS